MYRLASALDDICDHVDEATSNIASYGVQRVRPFSVQQADVGGSACRRARRTR
jgi:hypothetical protein